jgi:Cys-tRNA(Pro)/Cys-tRNA(Cys) deacylase
MVGQIENGSAAVGRQRFLADAAARGLDVQIVERLAARSLEEAAGILGITPADIVKSLVVKHKDGTFLFALIPGDRQISWPKLRARQHHGLAGVRGRHDHGPADLHGRRRARLQRLR